MLNITFSPTALRGYIEFQDDKKMRDKINALIKDIARNPTGGLGKVEKLKGDLSGCYSRRIDAKHRIVYRIGEQSCEILQVGLHYKDK
ncbi:Txe/YoeB family addiction module toxin [Helicobacter sp. MIT 21-1697]|uniref:Txe/YoeB family addiction module toxin n=1 Tax=Helicobacter sp. MIT 21-1697 TaxID=2993733 RepID=UPI00224A9E2C|nr:Txe/YoeB family addiction module toxin [Helicobacter sp. MIT 21-1697]MCX2717448.1 Txe/YoeB family addiction module toxin [Helicobacter sp. MIT 21-1697]